ncbi:MAG: nucleotide exchange factor GrpE [Rhizobiales bacterium]|nr:nucleotide exchange factor GrpE [Hyphomicrobiales bacterium]
MTNGNTPSFDAEENAIQAEIEAERLAEDSEENWDNNTDSRMAPTEAEAAADALQDASAQITALTEEVEVLKDRLLREMAEMENLRRRTAKEKVDANKYAITSFAKDMVSVGDNLDRALQSLPADIRANAADEIKNLFDGVELTNKDMLNIFDRHGIKQVNPVNEKFDPNFHQAMFEVPNPEVVAGTVLEVVQIGYAIGDRVLRPALVGIAKGGPKTAAPTHATAPEAGLGNSVDTNA